MIQYSLGLRQVQPGEPEQGNKTYPHAQVRQVMDLPALAKHMASHSSKYDKGDVMAVATQLTSCVREQLLQGNKVILGDLGAFSLILISDPADNAKSFSTSMIKQVKVHWEPSIEFKNLRTEATFEYVGTRKAQAEARKAEKELLNSKATKQPDKEPTPDPDDSEGGEGSLE